MTVPTSDERREVAARLREQLRYMREDKRYEEDLNVVECGNSAYRNIAGSVEPYGNFGKGNYVHIVERLADLIEPPEITEDTSDGYHTFAQLYYQRMMLFAVLVQEHKDCAWKTWNHEDGKPCFGGGWFLVTIDTPRGAYGYHFEAKYWRLFDCPELPKAKHWDGYTEENVNRLFSLNGYEVSGDAQ